MEPWKFATMAGDGQRTISVMKELRRDGGGRRSRWVGGEWACQTTSWQNGWSHVAILSSVTQRAVCTVQRTSYLAARIVLV